ncbi:MAG: PTS sugar transporter subunit IIA [Kiritimatiellia bacterium]
MNKSLTANGEPGRGSESEDEVMTLAEIAQYLKVSQKTIIRMAQSGEIPAAKVSNQWRFLSSMIDDWLVGKMQSATNADLVDIISMASEVTPISRLISVERIVMNMEPGSKSVILTQLVKKLKESRPSIDAGEYLVRLIEREEMVSTAIGPGVALPHPRDPRQTKDVAPCIVLGICPHGTEFESLDGKPTYVFALCCSNSEIVHLRLMAKVTLLLRQKQIVRQLRAAETANDVMRYVLNSDSELTTQF